MLNTEQFNEVITNLRELLDETNRALISEPLTGLIANNSAYMTRVAELEKENRKLKEEREELLLTNGKLFQKVTQEKEEIKKEEEPETKEEEIKVEDVINEKGEIING